MTTITSTVMFTDIVGSTHMATRLGEARYDPIRRAHEALLRSVVESSGGTIVKGLGDGIMATFAAAGDGMAAARTIQQTLHRRNRRQVDKVSVRIGLSIGDVIVDAGDYFGPPVVEAARLCAAAKGDQILASNLVRIMAREQRDEGFIVVGPMELKGLTQTVDVIEIGWRTLRQGPSLPLPERISTDDRSFVGRSRELEELKDAFERMRSTRRRQIVLVGGEPGVGKTTLVSRAVREWHEGGVTVALGWCEEDLRAPYRPFIEALGHLIAGAPADVLQAHVDHHGAGVLPLAPGLKDRLTRIPESISTDPETERLLLFSAVADLLARIGDEDPVVLVLDDLHWADAGTSSLLRSLAASADPAHLLIIGTFRDTELASDHPMGQVIADLRRVSWVTRLPLGGLESSDVVELVENWTGAEAGIQGAQLAGEVVEETGGNAFFVTELIRHLDETGQLAQPSTRVNRRTSMPDSIREVLGQRVARLGSAAHELLSTAAVIGAEFDLTVLSAVTGTEAEKALAILAEATSAALVREVADRPGSFLFTHALVQHAILANVGPTREAMLHRRVAESLEQRGQEGMRADALAQHWLQATGLRDSAKARDWARQAGDEALASLAPGDAAAYYRQALLLHDQASNPDVGIRIDLLIGLGTAQRIAGEPGYRATLLKASGLARRERDNRRLTAAVLANHRGSFSVFGAVDHERVEMLEAAIASCEVDADRARLYATLANELTYSGDFPRRRLLTDQALAAARSTGDDGLLLRVINLVFYSLWVPDTLRERLALTKESRALTAGIDDPLIRFWAAMADYLNLIQSGQAGAADSILAEARMFADRLAQPALQWRACHTAATRALAAGAPAEAERLAEEARDLGLLAGEPEAPVYFRYQLFNARWQRGSLAEIAGHLDATRPRTPGLTASLCLIFAEGGREEEALVRLEEAAAGGFADLPRDPAYLTGLANFAEATILLRATGPAETLYDLLLPFADQFGFDGVTCMGGLEYYVGALAAVLGRNDEAIARLRRNRDFHHAMPAPFFEARCGLQLARALVARAGSGDLYAASAEIERATSLALANGYRSVHMAASRLLAHIKGA